MDSLDDSVYSLDVRLSSRDQKTICRAVSRHDPDAQVFLFGSRVVPDGKGGDIDLLIISEKIGLRDEMRIRRNILDEIGWQKLDMIVRRKGQLDTPVSRLALKNGVALESPKT